MPKRRCVFTPNLKVEFPFLRDSEEIGKVLCIVCKSVFSIENGGRSDIKQHIKQKKHLLAVSSSSSKKVTNFFTYNQSTNESHRIAAEEGLFAYHTIIHNHSFRSMDCTTSIIKKIYEKKFACARTKCESIIVNVIAPFAIQQMLDELKSIKFLTIMVDTSNHKNLKLVPILIRYFNPLEGVKIKVLEFMNLKGETSNILSDYIINVLKKYNLLNNVVAFSGDNCNTNFGGISRKGTNNVFAILNEKLKRNISGIGCAAHILHNAMHSSTDILPTDIELIINKIFQYFHIYTVRIEKLKDFCDFVNIEYKNILGSVKTRWLSLQPAVSRIIDLYPALKSYFMSQEKCPTVLKTFFNDPVSIAWLYFVQSQLKVVCDTIKKIEGDHISACEVYEEIEVLCGKIKNRKSQRFFTSELAQLISDLDKNKLYSEKKFIEITDEFYDTFLSYVEKWGYHFEPLKVFRWIQLLDLPIWSDIQESFKYIIKNNPTLKFDEDEIFDEFNHVINVVKVKMPNWKNGSKAEDRWCEIFETLEKNNISIKYFTIILEYSMAIPGTNASVERVFSITNVLWTDEKNRFIVDTIRSIIIVKQHFKNVSCTEFYTFLLEHPQLLKLISSSEKYEKSNSEDTSEQLSSK